ncbi:MAG TPA: DUF6325 family protein [Candidatus Saccharimonadales bacterium]|nr:DUF6325 family protein [Candidatus Saccharimonadales bacterium]
MRGPIDYIIVGFEGNKFDGSILKAIGDAIDKGVIGLVALALVVKDAKGNVTQASLTESGDGYITEFSQKYKGNPELVDKKDIDEVADLLENNTSAGLLVIEQLWAKPLKEALIKANGVLVAEGRIHPEAAVELEGKGG